MSNFIELKEVGKVLFSIRSPEDIIRNSVVEVKTDDTINSGNPVENGLFDLRMGSIDYGDKCATCELNAKHCMGHPGYFRLASPVFHPLYLDIIKQLLESICFNCSRILLSENDINSLAKLKKTKRLKEAKNKKLSICPYCKHIQPNHRKTGIEFIYQYKGEESKREPLMPSLVLKLFQRITPNDAIALGFDNTNRPEYMILTILPILEPISNLNALSLSSSIISILILVSTNSSVGITSKIVLTNLFNDLSLLE